MDKPQPRKHNAAADAPPIKASARSAAISFTSMERTAVLSGQCTKDIHPPAPVQRARHVPQLPAEGARDPRRAKGRQLVLC